MHYGYSIIVSLSWFQSKITNFNHPEYFAPSWRGSSWNWVSAQWNEKLEWCATGPRKKFDDIFSRVDMIHKCDRQTDWHGTTAKTALTHCLTWVKTISRADNTIQPVPTRCLGSRVGLPPHVSTDLPVMISSPLTVTREALCSVSKTWQILCNVYV